MHPAPGRVELNYALAREDLEHEQRDTQGQKITLFHGMGNTN